MFATFGRASLADYYEDWIVYRNLEPLDKRVPGRKAAGYRMGLEDDIIPRKRQTEYAKATAWIVEEARLVAGVKKQTSELLMIGDTLYNDGAACQNIARLKGWRGVSFIGADRLDQTPSSILEENDTLYNANRWEALADWLLWLRQEKFQLDATTTVLIDIDKTVLGPKGRNDQVIDQARLQGIFRTMDSVLGERFNQAVFIQHYNELNRARYHFLTADNQDYLAYICLVLNAGIVQFEELMNEIQQGSLVNFEQFLYWADSLIIQRLADADTLREVHEAVLGSVRIGDPTPFKRFRRQEFVSTLEYMGNLPDDSPAKTLLAKEITLNEEVLQVSAWLKARGCFLLCLSDKPDEASRPTNRDTTQLTPLHRAATHRVGVDLSAKLAEIQ